MRSPSSTAKRGSVELPARYVAEHVELGWAVTGYGTQGDTVDVGIAVLDHTTSRNHAYVAMTRGRQANHAVLLDPTGIQDPTEMLVRIITRPAHGDSALAVQQRLHRDAGLAPPTHDHHPALEAPEPGAPEPGQPPWTEPTLEQTVDTLRRRLDQLEHRPVEHGRGSSLGL